MGQFAGFLEVCSQLHNQFSDKVTTNGYGNLNISTSIHLYLSAVLLILSLAGEFCYRSFVPNETKAHLLPHQVAAE